MSENMFDALLENAKYARDNGYEKKFVKDLITMLEKEGIPQRMKDEKLALLDKLQHDFQASLYKVRQEIDDG